MRTDLWVRVLDQRILQWLFWNFLYLLTELERLLTPILLIVGVLHLTSYLRELIAINKYHVSLRVNFLFLSFQWDRFSLAFLGGVNSGTFLDSKSDLFIWHCLGSDGVCGTLIINVSSLLCVLLHRLLAFIFPHEL